MFLSTIRSVRFGIPSLGKCKPQWGNRKLKINEIKQVR